MLEAELEQSRLGTDQAQLDAEGKVRQAEAQVAQAEAQLAQAEAEYSKAHADEERYTALAASGDIPEQKGSHARSAAEALGAAVRASRKQVDVARAALTSARATLANPAIRSSEGARIRQQIGAGAVRHRRRRGRARQRAGAVERGAGEPSGLADRRADGRHGGDALGRAGRGGRAGDAGR